MCEMEGEFFRGSWTCRVEEGNLIAILKPQIMSECGLAARISNEQIKSGDGDNPRAPLHVLDWP